MKRGDSVVFVPPWIHERDREHPDRARCRVVSVNSAAETAYVRFADHFHGEAPQNVHLRHLVATA